MATLPKPLSAPLESLGALLESALSWIPLPSRAGGGSVVAWAGVALAATVVAAAVVAAAVVAVARMARRLQRGPGRSPPRHGPATGPDPSVLEERALAAEESGDLTLAYRLRFQAGLVKLELSGTVPRARTMTSRQLSRRLQSPSFDRLAAALEQMVFAGRPATMAEVSSAPQQWRTVLDSTPRDGRGRLGSPDAGEAASLGAGR